MASCFEASRLSCLWRLLPCFYALSANYGELDDYLEQYRDGLLSIEARNVYEVLLREGALATSRLRQTGGAAWGRNQRSSL